MQGNKFYKVMENLLPMMRSRTWNLGGHAVKKVFLTNRLLRHKWDWDSMPYLRAMKRYNENVDEINDIMVIESPDMSAAVKAAVLSLDILHHVSEDEDGFYYDTDLYDDDCLDDCDLPTEIDEYSGIYHIDLSDVVPVEGGGNPYISAFSSYDHMDSIIVSGLYDDSNLEDKLKAIDGCGAYGKMLIIPEGGYSIAFANVFAGRIASRPIHVDAIKNEEYATLIKKVSAEAYNFGMVSPVQYPDAEKFVTKAKRKFGAELSEEKLAWILSDSDEFLKLSKEKSEYEKLMAMTGQPEFKSVVKEFIAVENERKLNPKLGMRHTNMIFYGNPGTGKTTMARILARIIAENKGGDMIIYEPKRSQLIGKYVGKTAPLVTQAFTKAKGGVLFIDEAGFLMQDKGGGYVEEALKEFVRLMDMYPDVTVIFALYRDQTEKFLDLDPGLESRIARQVEFKDYTSRELMQIASSMAKKDGYVIEQDAKKRLNTFLGARRGRANFGNAREVRRCVEAATTAVSLRHMDEDSSDMVITLRDMENGISRLKNDKGADKSGFGFSAKPRTAVQEDYDE